MTALLDSNVLIALALDDHVHHEAAVSWFEIHAGSFATSPSTQGSLVRALLRADHRIDASVHLLSGLTADHRHEFWPDDLAYTQIRLAGVRGQRQVTDAYLAHLARSHSGRVATLDRGFAALHADVADLVPTT